MTFDTSETMKPIACLSSTYSGTLNRNKLEENDRKLENSTHFNISRFSSKVLEGRKYD